MTPEIVATCVALCKASYDDNDPRFTTAGELRFGLINVDGQNYFVNRGTVNPKGWIHDFTAIPARTVTGYLAHYGFIDAAAETWDACDKLPDDVIITGHSLGGAISVVLAERFGRPCVTFGCPRVYSRLNKEQPVIEHHRYVNRGDLVPEVPDALAWDHLVDAVELGPEHLLVDTEHHDINLYVDNVLRSET